MATTDPKAFESFCKNFRKDGFYAEFSDTVAALQSIKNNIDTIGVIALTMALKNQHKVLSLDKVEPTVITLSRKIYSLTFPMWVYVKKAHVNLIPGFKEYLMEVTSEEAVSITGYYFDMGVIPLPTSDQKKIRADIQKLKVMSKL